MQPKIISFWVLSRYLHCSVSNELGIDEFLCLVLNPGKKGEIYWKSIVFTAGSGWKLGASWLLGRWFLKTYEFTSQQKLSLMWKNSWKVMQNLKLQEHWLFSFNDLTSLVFFSRGNKAAALFCLCIALYEEANLFCHWKFNITTTLLSIRSRRVRHHVYLILHGLRIRSRRGLSSYLLKVKA